LSHEEHPGAIVDLPGGGVQWKAPGFGAEVTSVAFAPDGKILASGDNDKTARLWDVATGRELHRLLHDDSVSSVAFDPSGTLLATGSKDAMARVWDTATGRVVFRIRHGEEVRKVAFSPDGRYLAAISTDGAISVVDVHTRAERHRWNLGEAGLGLAFSADGAHLATASGEYAAVWDVATGKPIFRAQHASLSPPTRGLNWIDDVAFSADGKLLATAGRDATARVWDVSSGQEMLRLQHGAPVSAVSFSRDGALLSTASVDGAARVWELSSGKERLRAAQPGGAETVEFSPDGSVAAAGAMNGAVEIWKLDRGDQVAALTQADSVNAVNAAANGMLAASSAGMVEVWSPRQVSPLQTVKLPVVSVDALIFGEQGTHLAAAWSSRLFLLDLSKHLAFTSLTDSRAIRDVAIGPRYVAAFDRERRALRVWETAGGRELPSIPDPSLDEPHFDVTGTVLAARHEDDHGNGFIGVWALPEGREGVRVPQQHSASFAIGPRGKTLAVSAIESNGQRATKYLDVYDGTTGARTSRIRYDGDMVASFNPQGDRLFLIQDTQLSVFDVATGSSTLTLGHEQEIRRARVSAEDGVLATLAGGNVYVWNYRTGQLLSQLTAGGRVLDVRFSADGRYLLTGSSDHTAVLWLWKTEDLRAAACTRMSRNLTRAEWARYLSTTPYRQTCQDLKPDPRT
jgi:WD40 repeat protein